MQINDTNDIPGSCAECGCSCPVDPNFPRSTLCEDCTGYKMGFPSNDTETP